MRIKTAIGLLVCILVSAVAFASPETPSRVRHWHANMTAIVLADNTPATERAVTAFVNARGGRIGLVATGLLVGWVPEEALQSIAAHPQVRMATRTPIPSASSGLKDPNALRAIEYFNWVASGKADADLDAAGPLRPIENDVLGLPPAMDAAKATAIPAGPLTVGSFKRARLTGKIAVNLILVEKETSPHYKWTEEDKIDAYNRVADSMAWWAQRYDHHASTDPITFSIDQRMGYHNRTDMGDADASEHPAILKSVMKNLCPLFNGPNCSSIDTLANSYIAAAEEFNDYAASLHGAAHGFTAFVAYNPPGARTTFNLGPGVDADGYATYLGGPFWVTLWRPGGAGILGQVAAHETGHLFFACDESAGSGCSTCGACYGQGVGPRPDHRNGNCDNRDSNVCYILEHRTFDCIMRGGSGYDLPIDEAQKVCSFTREQLGWREPPCFEDVPWDVGASTSWQGEYFDNTTFADAPDHIRNDGPGNLNKNFGTGSPGTSCMTRADNFSVRWKRKETFEAGTYKFTVDTDNAHALYVDGALVPGSQQSGPAGLKEYTFGMSAGAREVRLDYVHVTGVARASLRWEKLSVNCQPITATISSVSSAVCPNAQAAIRLSVTGGTGPWTVSVAEKPTFGPETRQLQFTVPANAPAGDFTFAAPDSAGNLSYTIKNVSDKNGCPGTGSGLAVVQVSSNPVFSGPATAASLPSECGIRVSWQPAASPCEPQRSIVYNVVRHQSGSQDVVVASCLPSSVLTFADKTIVKNTVYTYTVEAEDDSHLGAGRCKGGRVGTQSTQGAGASCVFPTTMTLPAVAIEQGQTAFITATLTAGGVGVPGKTVEIRFIDGDRSLLGTAVTNAAGQVFFSRVFNESPTIRHITAKFAGDATHFGSEASGTIAVKCNNTYIVTKPEGGLVVPQNGGLVGFQVFAPEVCTWEARSDSSWAVVRTPDGFGNGFVSLNVFSSSGGKRSATVTISFPGSAYPPKKVTIEQPDACTLRFQPNLAYLPSLTMRRDFNGNIVETLTTVDVITRADCKWTVSAPNVPWIHFRPQPEPTQVKGTGPGTVVFALDNNTGAARTGELKVVGDGNPGEDKLDVNQNGEVACIAPHIVIPVAGGTIEQGQNLAMRFFSYGNAYTINWGSTSPAAPSGGVNTSLDELFFRPGEGWYPTLDRPTIFYGAIVSNRCGADSTGATITVIPDQHPTCARPIIDFPLPTYATVFPGQAFKIEVAARQADANNTTPLRYQWYFGPTNDRSNPVGGSTTDNFIWVVANSTSFFWVEVINECGLNNSSTQLSNTGAIYATNGPRRRTAPHDFTGDERADLPWRNAATGQNELWAMSGPNRQFTLLLPPNSDLASQMQSVGDLNGDDMPDLIWRNPQSGQNSVWLMQGTGVLEERPMATRSDGRWSIAATGDFDGDDQHDIVWHNDVTGENEIWFQSGTEHDGTWALPTSPSPSWHLYGSDDFNGDTRPDLFFHNTATGESTVWMMNDATPFAKAAKTSGPNAVVTLPATAMSVQSIEPLPDTNWKPALIADLDGDHHPDIVWNNSATGANMMWQMSGTTKVASLPVPAQTDPNWQVGGAGGQPGSPTTEVRTATTLTATASAASLGGSTAITATLTANGAPLAGQKLTFRLASTVVAELLTDAAGTATGVASVEGFTTGTHAGAISVAFDGDSLYAPSSASADLVVGGGQSYIQWDEPQPIVYGTPLGAAQLNATANVAGTFTYDPPAGTVLPAGSHLLTVSFTPADAHYAASTRSVALVVNRGTPSVTWPAPAPISYGTALGGSQLNATSSLPGELLYEPAAGTILDVGTRTLRVTFLPDDANNYDNVTISTTIQVGKGTQRVTWLPPAAIAYGQPLSADQLSAFATGSGPAPAGALTFTPPAGTILPAGTHTLTATAAETASYVAASASAPITVGKARPVISWSNPAPIVYGTALGAAQLNASAGVAGTFAYTPAAGTILQAGAGQILSVQFTPSDLSNYEPVTKSVTIDVLKAKPVLTWPKPAAIVYGTALGATQLAATSSVAGVFVYTPAAGTILNAGASQTLSAQFTPSDGNNYETASITTTIDVAKARQTIVWPNPAPIVYGTLLGGTQLNAQLQVVGPAPGGALTYNPPAGALLQAGPGQTLSVSAAETPNYEAATATVAIDVLRAKPVITWTPPQAIIYGTPLTAAQLNATADVAGSFVYTPPAGTVLEAGVQTLTAQFTPADTRNYENASASVPLEVRKATPVITWAKPAGIVYGTPLGGAQLNATANVAGAFVYTPAAGTILDAGAGQTLSAHFTPSDTRNYHEADAAVTIDVAKARQELTWTPPAGIVYGTALGGAQLNAQVKVVGPAPAGALVYAPPAGTVLDAGAAQRLTVTAQETANYESASLSVTIDVARKPLALVVDAKSKLYGSPVPALTGVLTGVVNHDPITPSYATTATQQSVTGTYPITGSLLDPANRLPNYDVTIMPSTLTVLPAPLVISANAATKQYSDPVPALTATFTGLVLGETPAVLAGTLSIQTTAVRLSPPGSYPIAIGGLTSTNYAITYAGSTLTVTAEDARVAIISPSVVMTASPASGVATVTLAATVKDISATADAAGDGDAGDIRNATLVFVDRATNQPLCSAIVGLFDAADERVGVATCTFTATGSLTVGARIGGYYLRDAAADDLALTIARPSDADSIAGGGTLTDDAKFNVSLGYQKDGGAKGHFTYGFERDGKNYEITAVTVDSLAVRAGTASIAGTGTLRDVTASNAPVVIADAVPLVITATDGGEPSGRDALSVLLLRTGGGIWFATAWDGARPTEVPVRNGNIQVRSGK